MEIRNLEIQKQKTWKYGNTEIGNRWKYGNKKLGNTEIRNLEIQE